MKKNQGSFMFQKDTEEAEIFLTPTDIIEGTSQSKP